MNIETKYFDLVNIDEENIITIPNGLFGFEMYTKYVMLKFQEESDAMVSLQSVENKEIAFILINPLSFTSEYNPTIDGEYLDKIELNSTEEAFCYGICVLGNTLEESTINLKAPILLNTSNKLAVQALLSDNKYKFKHLISDFNKAVK